MWRKGQWSEFRGMPQKLEKRETGKKDRHVDPCDGIEQGLKNLEPYANHFRGLKGNKGN